MKRPTELDELDPADAAAAVTSFLSDSTSGTWRLRTFSVSDAASMQDAVVGAATGSGRFAPPGDYIALEQPTSGTLMMSNTPDELADHAHALEHATGRVLVHGLGLSCVVSGLLAKPDVTHVDVVELESDVIALVAPAYRDEPRVSIHHGDAMNHKWPNDAQWDYVWHDIWPTISDSNLEDESPSYRSLFQRFSERAAMQGAWAFDLAVRMDEATRRADAKGERLSERFQKATSDREREDVVVDYFMDGTFGQVFSDREAVRAMLASQDMLDVGDEPVFILDNRSFMVETEPDTEALVSQCLTRWGVENAHTTPATA